MTSKTYFLISGVFIGLYIASSIATTMGIPVWVHQMCTVIFAGAAYLGMRKKKEENTHDITKK